VEILNLSREDLLSLLEREKKARESLIKAYFTLAEAQTVEEVVQHVLTIATELTESEGASCLLIDENTGDLVFKAATGEKSQELIGMRVPVGKGIAGKIAAEKTVVIVSNAEKDKNHYKGVDKKTGFTTRNLMGVPMLFLNEQVIGVIEVVNKIKGEYTQWDAELLSAFANIAASVIVNTMLLEKLHAEKKKVEAMVKASPVAICIFDSNTSSVKLANDFFQEIEHLLPSSFIRSKVDNIKSSDKTEISNSILTILKPSFASFSTRITPLSENEHIVYLTDTSELLLQQLILYQALQKIPTKTLELLSQNNNSEVAHFLKRTKWASRLAAGPLRIERNFHSVTKLIDTISSEFEALFSKRNLNFNIFLENLSTEDNLLLDFEAVYEAIAELLSNSYKYTEKGEVTLTISKISEDRVYFTVKDTGIGFSDSDYEKLKLPVNRVEFIKRLWEGAFGLLFVQEVAKAHAGTFKVSSEIGKGATISFSVKMTTV